MSFSELDRIAALARIAGQLDDDPIVPPPARWGPASWWRVGLVAMAVMIFVLLVWRVLS